MKFPKLRNFFTALFIGALTLTVTASADQAPPGGLVTPTLGGIDVRGPIENGDGNVIFGDSAEFPNKQIYFKNSLGDPKLILNNPGSEVIQIAGEIEFFGTLAKRIIDGIYSIKSTEGSIWVDVQNGHDIVLSVVGAAPSGSGTGEVRVVGGNLVLNASNDIVLGGDILGSQFTTDIVAKSLDLAGDLFVSGGIKGHEGTGVIDIDSPLRLNDILEFSGASATITVPQAGSAVTVEDVDGFKVPYGAVDFGGDLTVTGDLTVDGRVDIDPMILTTTVSYSKVGDQSYAASCPNNSKILSCSVAFYYGGEYVSGSGAITLGNACFGNYYQTSSTPVDMTLQLVCL